jgi:hypothetical protein
MPGYQQNKSDDLVDAIYSHIDMQLRKGRFEAVDHELERVTPLTCEVIEMLAYLSITSAAKEHLPGRDRLVTRVRDHLTKTDPARVEELLMGLE